MPTTTKQNSRQLTQEVFSSKREQQVLTGILTFSPEEYLFADWKSSYIPPLLVRSVEETQKFIKNHLTGFNLIFPKAVHIGGYRRIEVLMYATEVGIYFSSIGAQLDHIYS